jgi:hypothetical protein
MGNLALAQNPPGHFDQGGAISSPPQKKPTRITLTKEEADFCRRMKIPFHVFAAHKAGLVG